MLEKPVSEKFISIISEGERIVFFGGAGVSTESGIPDFRSTDGLYNQQYKYPPETILSHDFFMENTEEFYRFYRDKMIYKEARPNNTHKALAMLEKQGKLSAIVTQNIDGLHQMAGSKKIYELHGSINRYFCMKCHKQYTLKDFLENEESVPHCSCGGILKPDVVLYGEGLDDYIIDASLKSISEADVLIVGGTSLTVQPAAGMIRYFRGNKLIVINKTATYIDENADLLIRANIGTVFGILL